jgi:hypothetical protein
VDRAGTTVADGCDPEVTMRILSFVHGVVAVVALVGSGCDDRDGVAGFPICTMEGCGTGSGTIPAPQLSYFQGKLVQHPHVVQVLFGTGTYVPEVFSTTRLPATVASFYRELVASGADDWLNEYNFGPYVLGRGGFVGTFRINATSPASLSDANVQTALQSAITSSALPFPDDNTLYMVHFPKGDTITNGTQVSCTDFCGYHAAFPEATTQRSVRYAVLPDLTDGLCATGCGTSTTFANQTSVASHELVEMVTNPDAPFGTRGWFDADPFWLLAGGEIGDICVVLASRDNGPKLQVGFKGRDGVNYTAQSEWSNRLKRCGPGPRRSGADLLWRYTNGQLATWFDGDLDPVRKPPVFPALVDPAWQVLGVGDFDGDGFTDILWRYTGPTGGTQHGQIAIWYKAQTASPVPAFPGVQPDDVAFLGAGDFDGDGQDDIAWRNTGSVNQGQVTVWYGGGFLGQTIRGTLDLSWQTARVGDFDGDGKTDILWRSADRFLGDRLLLWSAATPVSPSSASYIGPGIGWASVAVGDFDGDGHSDVCFRQGGQLAIWFSGTQARPPLFPPHQLDSSWSVLGAGDFDVDGKSDLFLRQGPGLSQGNGGQIEIWFGGTTDVPPALPAVLADTGWQLQGIGHVDF